MLGVGGGKSQDPRGTPGESLDFVISRWGAIAI